MATYYQPLQNCRPVRIGQAKAVKTSSDPAPTVSVSFGFVHDATGSARVRIGETEAICSVFGPRVESIGASGFSDSGKIEVDVKYCTHASDAKKVENEISLTDRILEALNTVVCRGKYPKCTISVFIVFTQACGNDLTTALVASSMALVDAAVEIFDVIAPCSMSIINDSVLLNVDEVEGQTATLTASYSPSVDAFPHIFIKGRLDVSKLTDFLLVAKQGSLLMRQELLKAIRERSLMTLA